MKTCCCIGHGPEGFYWYYGDKECKEHKEYLAILEYVVEKHIKNGYDHFIIGCAMGTDMDYAQTLFRFHLDKYPYIQLKLETLKTRPRDMIKRSDAVIAIWNGKRKGEPFKSIKYAMRKKKQIEFIGLPPLCWKDQQDSFDFYIEFPLSLENKKKKDEEWQKIKERLHLS